MLGCVERVASSRSEASHKSLVEYLLRLIVAFSVSFSGGFFTSFSIDTSRSFTLPLGLLTGSNFSLVVLDGVWLPASDSMICSNVLGRRPRVSV